MKYPPAMVSDQSTARGMCRFGLSVSSARLAAVSNPVNSSTPYSTANRMPLQPSLDEEGLNAFTLLSEPVLAMTYRKNSVSTVIDRSASTSCARVDTWTPRCTMASSPASRMSCQARTGIAWKPNWASSVSCTKPPMRTAMPAPRTSTPA
jgi:hypothetical protein